MRVLALASILPGAENTTSKAAPFLFVPFWGFTEKCIVRLAAGVPESLLTMSLPCVRRVVGEKRMRQMLFKQDASFLFA
ncbi:hypothetical protein T265_08205 [Opisthorchis viverrini]|uniref:Uncharacterized protein n=1 Tax=Opisthorchis viverrini TaxID=6198 RepID=A0A074ZEE7_OPIVI|nr:hypothetical protein T265_08205 [Opisthorchis viverrini]KER24032.1 hypothetical protein T265_08205 [Opisthorchis viverrini]